MKDKVTSRVAGLLQKGERFLDVCKTEGMTSAWRKTCLSLFSKNKFRNDPVSRPVAVPVEKHSPPAEPILPYPAPVTEVPEPKESVLVEDYSSQEIPLDYPDCPPPKVGAIIDGVGKKLLPYASRYEENIDFSGNKTDIKTLAFYLPQFHTFPENDKWWGKGFTEWTNTRKAVPRFPGHYQPREPHSDIGYYDLSDYKAIQKQAELAKQHGIYGFCIYHYWFSGKRLMEKVTENILNHPEIDLKYCLCWANENWTRTWDGKAKDVLISQQHENQDVDYIKDLAPFLKDPRYIKVDGKPLVMVYNVRELPDPVATMQAWRVTARAIGIGEITIWGVRGGTQDGGSIIVDGMDGEVEFPPAQSTYLDLLYSNPGGVALYNYDSHVERLTEGQGFVELYDKDHPVYRGAMLGWDCSARRKGYHAWYGYSLEKYYKWLRYNIDYTRKHQPEDRRFMFINAWNEWAEGTYLEPDKKYGYAALNTTSKAIFDLPFAPIPEKTGNAKIGTPQADLEERLLRSTCYFNPREYMAFYTDLAQVNMNPYIHFILAGWKENRTSARSFPTGLYTFFNKGVRGKENPVLHFLKNGADGVKLASYIPEFDRLRKECAEKLGISRELITKEVYPFPEGKKIAVHLHLFYVDMIPEISRSLQHIDGPFDLFVSVVKKDDEFLKEVETGFRSRLFYMDKLNIRTVENRGRDMAPFFEWMEELSAYDFICHIHSKKSLHTSAHAAWAPFLFQHLFGRNTKDMNRIFHLMDKENAKVVYPPDYTRMETEPSGWGSNVEFAADVLKMDAETLEKEFPVIDFPQGSMFWSTGKVIKKLQSLGIKTEDFPPEPIGVDGTIAHALERLLLVPGRKLPGKCVQLHCDEEEMRIYNMRYFK